MQSTDNNLSPGDVAAQIGVSLRTLNRWHALRVGPPRCKVGRKVLYRQAAINNWLEANETQPIKKFVGGVA